MKASKLVKKEVMQFSDVAKALEYVKENDKAKFNGSIELHINLNIDIKKTDQNIRFALTLPNGTGKTLKVAVLASKKVAGADLELSEQDIEKLEKGSIKPKVDFDVLISEPRFMAKLAKAARILGPAGVMPNPKNGTVAEDVEKAVEQVKKGKVEIRTEANAAVIHTIIGKKNFETKKLEENFEEIMQSIRQHKPQKAKPDWIKSAFFSATMGPSAQIEVVKYL